MKLVLQDKKSLKISSVLIIGIGALASPNCYYLSASGVGKIGLIDNDKVEKKQSLKTSYPYSKNVR